MKENKKTDDPYECVLGNPALRCDPNDRKCINCGWNPDVHALRLSAWLAQQSNHGERMAKSK